MINQMDINQKANLRMSLTKYAGCILAITLLVSLIGVYFTRYNQLSTENLRDFIGSFGMWAPVAYGIIYIAASPVPFVATLLSTTGGVLFGPVRGTLYAIAIASISALVPFTLTRHLGRDWVTTKLKGKRLEHLLLQTPQRYGFILVLLTRLIPVLPWEIQNYVLGLTNVSIRNFFLGTLIGTIPGTFSLVYLGDSLTKLGTSRLWVALGLNVATLLVPALVLLSRNMQKKRQQVLP